MIFWLFEDQPEIFMPRDRIPHYSLYLLKYAYCYRPQTTPKSPVLRRSYDGMVGYSLPLLLEAAYKERRALHRNGYNWCTHPW